MRTLTPGRHAQCGLYSLLIELSDADDEVLIFGNDLRKPLELKRNKTGERTWEVMLPPRRLYKVSSKRHPEKFDIIELEKEGQVVPL